MQPFCEIYDLKGLIKQQTTDLLKNPNRPTWIHLILANVLHNFQNTFVEGTVLSDFYLMNLPVTRKCFKKIRPRIINYRCFKQFSNEAFRET